MYVVIGTILQLLWANFFNSEWFYRILEQSPPIVPYSVIMDTTQCVGGSHSSSPSVKSWLQHLNLFPDYIFVTLSTPFPSISSISPPPTLLSLPFPSLASKLSTSSLVPLLQLLHHDIRLISPHLLSQNLSFLLPQLPPFLPLLFLLAQVCLRLFTSIIPPDGLC